MTEYRAKVMKVAGVIAKNLHIPTGVAVILAVILVPKVLAILMILWYAIGLISARRITLPRPDDKGE